MTMTAMRPSVSCAPAPSTPMKAVTPSAATAICSRPPTTLFCTRKLPDSVATPAMPRSAWPPSVMLPCASKLAAMVPVSDSASRPVTVTVPMMEPLRALPGPSTSVPEPCVRPKLAPATDTPICTSVACSSHWREPETSFSDRSKAPDSRAEPTCTVPLTARSVTTVPALSSMDVAGVTWTARRAEDQSMTAAPVGAATPVAEDRAWLRSRLAESRSSRRVPATVALPTVALPVSQRRRSPPVSPLTTMARLTPAMTRPSPSPPARSAAARPAPPRTS